MVARGHHRLVALPLSLSRLGEEFPAAMALEQQRHPTLMYDYGRPLGPDPRVLALLAERLNEAATELARPRALELAGARPRLRAVDSPPAEDLHQHIEPGRPPSCWSARAPPTPPPTPRSTASPGCSGRRTPTTS
ncbi:sirohydrochlorin chelatase [Nonomuraea thailandensis]